MDWKKHEPCRKTKRDKHFTFCHLQFTGEHLRLTGEHLRLHFCRLRC